MVVVNRMDAQMDTIERELSDLEAREIQLAASLHSGAVESFATLSELQAREMHLAASPNSETSRASGASGTLGTVGFPATPTKSSPYECGHLVVILRKACGRELQQVLQWLQTHGSACYSSQTRLTIAVSHDSSESSEFISLSHFNHFNRLDRADFPPVGQCDLTDVMRALPNRDVHLCVFGPLEWIRGCVGLVQQTERPPDLVVISGCRALSRREYEAPDYTPLLEEIVLKEAVQPVILLKQ